MRGKFPQTGIRAVDEQMPFFFRLALKQTKNVEDAEDAISTLALKVVSADMDHSKNPGGYANRMLHNILYDMRRIKGRRPELADDPHISKLAIEQASVEPEVLDCELEPWLEDTLNSLTEAQASMIRLRWLGLSEKEAYGALGITRDNGADRMRRAREKFYKNKPKKEATANMETAIEYITTWAMRMVHGKLDLAIPKLVTGE